MIIFHEEHLDKVATTFFANMARNVNDEDPVWRYLLEKIGHVALLTLTLIFVIPLPPLGAAIVTACAYDLIGKALWFNGRPISDKVAEAKDTLYDLWVTLLVALIVGVPIIHLWVIPGFAVWLLGIILGSLYQWGSPS